MVGLLKVLFLSSKSLFWSMVEVWFVLRSIVNIVSVRMMICFVYDICLFLTM